MPTLFFGAHALERQGVGAHRLLRRGDDPLVRLPCGIGAARLRDHAALNRDVILDRLAAARLGLAYLRRPAPAGEDRQRDLHARGGIRCFLRHADTRHTAAQ